jgi:hypothetical protein
VLAVLPDGSYLTRLGTLRVRVVDARVTVTTSGGDRWSEHYRLATTLLDHRRDPASVLVRLYHERWEVESAFYGLRHTLLDGLVLRSQDPTGLAQELWAQLTVYQLLRMAMVEAAESRPGTDPDRAGFTIALETARDHVILASGRDDTTSIAVGAIGRHLPGASPCLHHDHSPYRQVGKSCETWQWLAWGWPAGSVSWPSVRVWLVKRVARRVP